MNPIWIIIGTVLASVISTFLKMWHSKWLEKKEKEKQDVGHTVNLNQKIYEELYALMHYLNADHLFIARLHNGGKFADGMPMEKLSITNEVYTQRSQSIQQEFQNVLLSRFTSMMFELLYHGRFYRSTSKSGTHVDFFKSLQLIQQAQSTYCVLLKNIDGMPIAFLAIAFIDQKRLSDTETRHVEHKKDKFINLLTASYRKYKK